MAHLLFSHSHFFWHCLKQKTYDYREHQYYWENDGYFPGKIRLSIFLIIEVVAGLPAVVWALRVLYHHHKSGSQVSAFMITLLLSDLLVLILNPYIVIKLLKDDFCWERRTTCRVLSSLWSGSIIYGVHLQQVVALEGVLSLRHPPCSAHVFFPSCSIIISIILYICFILCEVFSVTVLILIALPLLLATILVSWIITCRSPPSISDAPYRSIKPSFTVLAFVRFIVILYVTFSIIVVIVGFWRCSWDLFITGVCLMSLNVIIDPLLCVLICRKHSEINKSEVNV